MTVAIQIRAMAAVLAAALPMAAQAEVRFGGSALTGYVELEHLFSDDDSQTFFNADLGYSTTFGAQLGFDVGLRMLAAEDDTFHALYGAVSYATPFGKFSAGVPRPVIADMVRFPPIGGIRTLDLELGVLTGSIAELIYLTEDTVPLGLRYDGRFGDVAVGASFHHFDDVQDADVWDLVLRYEIGNFAVFGAAEHVNISAGPTETEYTIGVEGKFDINAGHLRAGLAWYERDLFGGGVDGLRAHATYMPTDRIDLTGSLLTIEGDQFYGIDMRYRFYEGAYAGLGVADGDFFDPLYNFSLGWQF